MRGLLKFLSIMAILAAMYYARYSLTFWKVEQESSFFVTDAVTKITGDWSVAAFNIFADHSFKSNADIVGRLADYKKLGALAKPPACALDNFDAYKYEGTSANYIGATYQCQVVFKNAPATIQLVILRYEDTADWKISDFRVYSSYLPKASQNGRP